MTKKQSTTTKTGIEYKHLKSHVCIVCEKPNVYYINKQEVGCKACGSVYPVKLLLKKKG